MVRMKINITCPSACIHFEPATMKANPAAFSIISTEISMKIMLRLTSTLIRPSINNIPANNNPDSIGIAFILLLFQGNDEQLFSSDDLSDTLQLFQTSTVSRTALHQSHTGHTAPYQQLS